MLKKYNLKLDHIGSYAKNLDDISNFYEKVLGFEAKPAEKSEELKQEMQYFEKDGYVLEFICPERELEPSQLGFKHLAFTCNELDSVFAEIKSLGYKTFMEEPLRYLDRRFFFFQAPNGALIEFMEYDKKDF